MMNFDEIKKIAQNCLNCNQPLCVEHCPLHNPIPEVLSLIKEDQIQQAADLLFNNTNASPICSNLCDFNRQCYGNCVLNHKQKAIKFYEVEKYLSQYYKMFGKKMDLRTEKVAVIGAGISGLSVAIDLAIKGYNVTIFEKNSQIGGVLTDTIPPFRFDEEIIEVYQKLLGKLEIVVHYQQEFGQNLLLDDLSIFKYVIMAMGTQSSKKTLENSPYHLDCLEILRRGKKHQLQLSNKTILVIGGGNVAMDVARTLKRAGNIIHIVYRRDILNAPANQNEIKDALKEGIIFDECLAPIRCIYEDDVLKALEVEKMMLVDDPSSKRKTFQKTGEFLTISCEYIVEAIGLNAQYDYLKSKLPTFFNEKGWIIDEGYVKYHNQYILATGDFFSGASNFAKAAAEAKKTIQKMEKLK